MRLTPASSGAVSCPGGSLLAPARSTVAPLSRECKGRLDDCFWIKMTRNNPRQVACRPLRSVPAWCRFLPLPAFLVLERDAPYRGRLQSLPQPA